jgi:hypothetical protein
VQPKEVISDAKEFKNDERLERTKRGEEEYTEVKIGKEMRNF